MEWSSTDQASEIHETSDRRNVPRTTDSTAEEAKWLQLDARKGMLRNWALHSYQHLIIIILQIYIMQYRTVIFQ
jgi:hypothetical protein